MEDVLTRRRGVADRGHRRENMRSDHAVLPAGHDRVLWRYTPPPFEDGVRLAFVIAVSRPALLPGGGDGDDVIIGVQDRWDRLACARILMTEPGGALSSIDPLLAEPWTLTSGRRVWLTARSEVAPAMEPEDPSAGAIVQPMWPEAHGVTAPGFLLKGVRLSAPPEPVPG
jgi:hypothetical protein